MVPTTDNPPLAGSTAAPSREELAFAPATEQAELVRRREVSPIALLEAYLERIERLDGQLSAYVTVAADRALEDARLAERMTVAGGEIPPFLGIPLSVKDLTDTAGIRTTYSSRAFASSVPAHDTALVRRLRDAGFVVLGKTNTPEFGTLGVTESELNGVCRNPWNPALNAGGSSGGAAAALAAGLCAASHGTDGGGSIRIPASCCGVVGLKPSRGRVSDSPSVSATGFGTAGPIARTVADAAALLDVMSGPEPGDSFPLPPPERAFAEEAGLPPGRLRVGCTATPPIDVPIDRACVAALEDAAALLGELGHDVEEATPDWRNPDLLAAFEVLQGTGPALADVDPSLMTPVNRFLAEAAAARSSVEYVRTYLELLQYGSRVAEFWAGYDVLLTPTLALPSVPAEWAADDDPGERFQRDGEFSPFTPAVNVTGQPAVSVPLCWTEEGLPVGIQLVGRPGAEGVLLRLAHQLEEARPWGERRPPLATAPKEETA